MNSFEENIKKQQLLQKSFAETFTGQNEVFKIIETLQKAGVPEDEMIEKAKYIRREGAPGNYKYIYEEPKSNFGDSGKKDKKSQSSDLQKAEQTEDQKAKIAKVMREFKEGKLKSSSGEVITDKKQAIAIALSEAGLSRE